MSEIDYSKLHLFLEGDIEGTSTPVFVPTEPSRRFATVYHGSQTRVEKAVVRELDLTLAEMADDSPIRPGGKEVIAHHTSVEPTATGKSMKVESQLTFDVREGQVEVAKLIVTTREVQPPATVTADIYRDGTISAVVEHSGEVPAGRRESYNREALISALGTASNKAPTPGVLLNALVDGFAPGGPKTPREAIRRFVAEKKI